ncbi:MAG: phosphoribosylanthranilate isomerase [Thermoanaerobaculia bacterium]|nr:phosphoribosylanthranilate isomerase [Thermoanaerobaculia bacterium]
MRPLVKICGVTRTEDAELVAELGADFVGFNFYPGSPRCVTLGAARELGRALSGSGVRTVGVFVNRPPDEVDRLADELELDLLQFHGDEGPAQLARYRARAIKVFRRVPPPVPEVLAAYSEVWGFLFDLPKAGEFGGSGSAWDYRAVAGVEVAPRRLLVAGGIGPDNARSALVASGADGIDLCSRIESAPGIKDRALLRALFEELSHG